MYIARSHARDADMIQAEGVHFKVPVYALPAEEGIFSAMFEFPNENGEGSDDDNPIYLPPEVSADEFRSFLKACVPMCVLTLLSSDRALIGVSRPDVVTPNLAFREWMNVHKLATMWCLDKLRAKVIDSADKLISRLSPTTSGEANRDIQRVLRGKQYHVSRWLLDGYEALAMRDTPLSVADRTLLGAETSIRILELREKSFAWALEANKPPTARNPYITLAELRMSTEYTYVERRTFDYQSAIRTMFEEELRLDPNYTSQPKAQA